MGRTSSNMSDWEERFREFAKKYLEEFEKNLSYCEEIAAKPGQHEEAIEGAGSVTALAGKTNKLHELFRHTDRDERVETVLQSAGELFLSFQCQFMSVTDTDGASWARAMEKLAVDAVDRIVGHLMERLKAQEVSDITSELLVRGVLECGTADIPKLCKPEPGHSLRHQIEDWDTAELYCCTGLVVIPDEAGGDYQYYRRKAGDKADKYGYRLKLSWESQEAYIVDEKPVSEYKYDIDQTKIKEILETLSKDFRKPEKENRVKIASEFVDSIIALCYLGHYEKPEKKLELALTIQGLGLDHIVIADTLGNLGRVLNNQRDHEKAKEISEMALKIQEKHRGHDHVDIAEILVILGGAIYNLGDRQKANEIFQRGLKIQEKHLEHDHIDIAETLVILGGALYNLGDHEKAKELLERALKIQEKQLGHDHIDIAETLVILGGALYNLGDRKKANEIFQCGLKIQEKHLEHDHIDIARTLRSLGRVLNNQRDHEKAKEILERALNIQEDHLGTDHVDIAETLAILASSLFQLGDHEKAKELLDRALKIQEKRQLA